MSDFKCAKCGCTPDEKSLHGDSFRRHLKDMYCWTCYVETVIEKDLTCWSVGIVGDNSGYMDDYKLADAIDFAINETEDNIDKGLSIEPPISNGYNAAIIVRNGQVYTKCADLRDLFDIKDDDKRLEIINRVVKNLNFKLIEE